METRNRPAIVLAGVALLALLVAFALWSLISAGMFVDRDVISGGIYDEGPSVWVAAIPAVIAVIAAIGAVVMWATRASARPTQPSRGQ